MKKDIPAPNAEPELPPFSENPSMTFFLEAIGWMELGNGEEALSSIEQIVDKYAIRFEVLALKWSILYKLYLTKGSPQQ